MNTSFQLSKSVLEYVVTELSEDNFVLIERGFERTSILSETTNEESIANSSICFLRRQKSSTKTLSLALLFLSSSLTRSKTASNFSFGMGFSESNNESLNKKWLKIGSSANFRFE